MAVDYSRVIEHLYGLDSGLVWTMRDVTDYRTLVMHQGQRPAKADLDAYESTSRQRTEDEARRRDEDDRHRGGR